MPQSEPSQINQLQRYQPPCAKCGQVTTLVGIEPAPEPEHDLLTYECSACGKLEAVTVKFR